MPELYEIVDPRPVAASAKYTFFLPTADCLNAVGTGDLVQVTARAIPPSEKWDAERVWVRVESANPDWIEGTLESVPDDMPLLSKGAKIRAPRSHIINIAFESPDKKAALKSKPRREFWERCLVDQAVLDGELLVQYLYREAPDLTRNGDKFPDSGWRIRGDMRNASEEELAKREVAYVALGAVLNYDDSWVQFIDEPVGSAFERDFERGVFVRAP
jgi:hypothetical protein